MFVFGEFRWIYTNADRVELVLQKRPFDCKAISSRGGKKVSWQSCSTYSSSIWHMNAFKGCYLPSVGMCTPLNCIQTSVKIHAFSSIFPGAALNSAVWPWGALTPLPALCDSRFSMPRDSPSWLLNAYSPVSASPFCPLLKCPWSWGCAVARRCFSLLSHCAVVFVWICMATLDLYPSTMGNSYHSCIKKENHGQGVVSIFKKTPWGFSIRTLTDDKHASFTTPRIGEIRTCRKTLWYGDSVPLNQKTLIKPSRCNDTGTGFHPSWAPALWVLCTIPYLELSAEHRGI